MTPSCETIGGMESQDEGPHLPDAASEDTSVIERASNDAGREASPLISVFANTSRHSGRAFGSLAAPAIKNLAGTFTPLNTANWFPHVQMTNLFLPQLQASVFDAVKALSGDILKQQLSATVDIGQALFRQHHEQWGAIFASLRKLADTIFPPNWKDVRVPEISVIMPVLLDEGIPLAWIPCPDTVQAVFDASDAAGRRQVVARRWRHTVSDCEVALEEVRHASLRCHQPFAKAVVQALRDGHSSAAQALAANLLDSILRRNFDKAEFKIVTSNRKDGNRLDLDDYQVRAAFTLAPIWRAYAQYWDSQGDPIPRTFGRHPSAHAVSRTQYSRINAVTALMLVTSLLKLLDVELGRESGLVMRSPRECMG